MKRSLTALIPLACAAAVCIQPCRPARADEAVASLAKYNEPVDKSIDRALVYLAKAQHKQGYWPSGLGKNTAVASLSVMAFLAKGYTPGTGPYGENIDRGIDFVLGSQRANGILAGGSSRGPMYSHGISTLMLSEVSGMVDPKRQKRLDKGLARAVKLILAAQQVKKNARHQGGWRYQPTSRDSDMSLTGWALMSLRSTRGNGSLVPKKAIDDGVRFVLNCRDRRAAALEKKPRPRKKKKGKPPRAAGVGFAYQPGGSPGLARTGVAVLCLELCGRHRSKESLAGGEYILAHPAKAYGGGYFFYAQYYCSQAMFQIGGKYWERFAPRMYEMMLKQQSKDGSWRQGGGGEAKAGRCYSTAMAVLAMSVSYRQLPIYQR